MRTPAALLLASPLLGLTLGLGASARAAAGWTGVQTTTPVDRPADEAPPGPTPGAAAGVGGTAAATAPPLATPEEIAARWGLLPAPQGASPADPSTTAARWATPEAAAAPPAPAPPPPAPMPDGPPPPNPYRAIDYTAYTLELGEVRLGINQIGVGIAPRVQLTTTPWVYGLGAWNIEAKGNVVRAGPLDFALFGGVDGLVEGRTFQAFWTRTGAMVSVRPTGIWTLHAGGGWDHIYARGLPSQAALYRFVWDAEGRQEVDDWTAAAQDNDGQLDARQDLATLRFATDVRFNRRDALVLQASGVAWGSATTYVTAVVEGEQVDLPPVLGLDEITISDRGGAALARTWQASLAYQATFRYAQLRVGWGLSAQPWIWLPNTLDLSWRFGGRTRRSQAAWWDHYRTNRRLAIQAAHQPTAP